MKQLSDRIFQYLYTDSGIGLQTLGILVGLLLIVLHVIALVKPAATKEWLVKLPRSQSVGTVLLTIGFIWAMIVATSMDLGEFGRMRYLAQYALPAMYLSLLFYTNEYLGARSLGILAILAACPLLNAAFQKPPQTRMLLAGLCYVWILLGLFWVGMPHTLRDQITWVTKTESRIKLASLAGIAYGAVMLLCAILFWKIS